MLLKSLYIKNFRQFKGETTVDFACDKEKNVTIILGDNTFGKTTLLQAFNWCFYNFVVFDKDSRPDFLLNHELAATMKFGSKETVEIQITLIHNNTQYTLTRSQDYIWTDREVRSERSKVSMCYKPLNSDGQTEIRDQYIENAINEILPKNLSNYFFFDTERVRDVSNRQDVSESVKGLLGLTALDNTMKHIGSKTAKTTVLGKLYGSMDNEGNKKASEALERINSTQARKTAIAEQLETLKTQISDYEAEKERLDSIIKDNQGTATMQNRVLSLERMIKTETDALEQVYAKFIIEFNNGTLTFFAKPLMDRASAFLKEAQVDDKGIKDMTDQSIYEILKRKICICGTPLEEGSKAHEEVMKQLKFLPPESIGTSIRNFKEKIASYEYSNRNYFNNLKSRYEDIFRMKTRIQEWTDELNDTIEKIRGKEDMKKFAEKLAEVKLRLKEFNDKRDRLIREDESCNNDIERFQKAYDSLVAVSSKNKSIMFNIRYAEEILEWISKTYKEKEFDIRERLEEKVNLIFNRIYHGQRRVNINEKYHVSLLTMVAEKEMVTGESEGLNRVKNFAFIAGLVDLAKEKISTVAGESQLDLSSEPYPLVMDAPFSNADATHTTNISKVLPEVAEQVIMFVMEKDWRYAEPVMAYRVGSKWLLKKKTDTLTILERSEA